MGILWEQNCTRGTFSLEGTWTSTYVVIDVLIGGANGSFETARAGPKHAADRAKC
jgi:hypothetical protein